MQGVFTGKSVAALPRQQQAAACHLACRGRNGQLRQLQAAPKVGPTCRHPRATAIAHWALNRNPHCAPGAA